MKAGRIVRRYSRRAERAFLGMSDAERQALFIVIVFALLAFLFGCSAIVGNHPFSSQPKADLGKPAEFNPGLALHTELSVPPEVLAIDKFLDDNGKTVPVKFVTLFVLFRHPFEPWRGAVPVIVLTNGKRFRFPQVPDHSWSLQGPFGVGAHTLVVEIWLDGQIVYQRQISFAVFPVAPSPEWTAPSKEAQ